MNYITDKKTKNDTIECSHKNMVNNILKIMIPNMISMEIYRVDSSHLNIVTAIHSYMAIGLCVCLMSMDHKMSLVASKKH